MARAIQLCLLVCVAAAAAAPAPDSGGSPPLPGPGLSYGGIPYGSVSGDVAAYFDRGAQSSGRQLNYAGYKANDVNYAPIEQYL